MVADKVALHRDVRNESGSRNFVSHVSSRQLWVEESTKRTGEEEPQGPEDLLHVALEGTNRKGHIMPVGQSVIPFDPKQYHTLLPAANWVIAGYTPLGFSNLPAADLETLVELGFRLPPPKDGPRVCKLVGPNPQMLQPARTRARPPPRPGRVGMHVRLARMSGQEWEELCQLDEEQVEQGFARRQRVLGGHDEDVGISPLSAAIPQRLLVETVMEQRDWDQDPILTIRFPDGTATPVARVFQFSDDGYVDDMPFPDRMLMFSIHDYVRDIFEMILLRVEMMETPEAAPEVLPLEPPGPPPPEIRAVRCLPATLQGHGLVTAIKCPGSRGGEGAKRQRPLY